MSAGNPAVLLGGGMFSVRAATVLNLLVNEYVHTVTSVTAEEIARNPALRVTSAALRNTMSQLTDDEYISRPHTSAGGILSDLWYRRYVESIPDTVTLPGKLGGAICALDPNEWDTRKPQADLAIWPRS